jgi:hypothetical protein
VAKGKAATVNEAASRAINAALPILRILIIIFFLLCGIWQVLFSKKLISSSLSHKVTNNQHGPL